MTDKEKCEKLKDAVGNLADAMEALLDRVQDGGVSLGTHSDGTDVTWDEIPECVWDPVNEGRALLKEINA